MKTLIRLENGIEASRKSGYANVENAKHAGDSWLNDCTVHAELRKKRTIQIV
jgi:phage terminase small subunit